MKQQSLLSQGTVDDTFVSLDLPWPPSANHYNRQMVMLPKKEEIGARWHEGFESVYKFIRRGSRVMTFPSNEAKEFDASVMEIVMRYGARKMWLDRCRISIWAYPPDRRRRDTSNLWKMVEDALVKAGVVKDDVQFDEHYSYIMRDEVIKHGKVVVRVERLL